MVVQQAGHLHLRKGEEGAREGEAGEEGEGLPLLAETREVVAEPGSQLQVVGEEAEGQQNQGEVEKMEVKVVVGSLETQILQVVVGVEYPSLEVEVEGQVVEKTRAWGLAESLEEELVVDGWG